MGKPTRFSLTMGPGSGILKTLRGVAPGVCVCSPGSGWWIPLKGSTGTGHRLPGVASARSSQSPFGGRLPAILTRTGLFGSG
jgi:hypothetical protein